MKTSESIASLAKALPALQAEIKTLSKDSKGYNYKYADLVQVVETAKPVLKKNGFSIVQMVSQRVSEHTLETMLLHESGEYIASDMKLVLSKQDMQGLGSAITYARRYAFMAIIGMVAHDEDDDGESISVATEKQINLLKQKAYQKGIKTSPQFEDALYQAVGVTSQELPKSDVDKVLTFFDTGELSS